MEGSAPCECDNFKCALGVPCECSRLPSHLRCLHCRSAYRTGGRQWMKCSMCSGWDSVWSSGCGSGKGCKLSSRFKVRCVHQLSARASGAFPAALRERGWKAQRCNNAYNVQWMRQWKVVMMKVGNVRGWAVDSKMSRLRPLRWNTSSLNFSSAVPSSRKRDEAAQSLRSMG